MITVVGLRFVIAFGLRFVITFGLRFIITFGLRLVVTFAIILQINTHSHKHTYRIPVIRNGYIIFKFIYIKILTRSKYIADSFL